MFIHEAIKSKRPFKRLAWKRWATGMNRYGKPCRQIVWDDTHTTATLTTEDLEADDYILKPVIVPNEEGPKND